MSAAVGHEGRLAGIESVVGFESVAALDSALARVARASGRLRLALADGLEALARIGGHQELGFCAVEAYALERCERKARWVQESRALSRRLRELPAVRRAVLSGEISYSMAQVVVRVAGAEDEEPWLAEARQRTVRGMREFVEARGGGETSAVSEEPRATLTVTLDREDAWLFESARMLVKRVAGGTLEDTVDALLAEGTTSLLASVEREAIVPFDEAADEDVAQRAWEAELSRFREEAEVLCEARIARRNEGVSDELAVDWDWDAEQIDANLRRVAAELGRRDLVLGELAERFWSADGWRRLGYATATQYARERLGMSESSVKAKRALARQARAMPRLREAVDAGELGFEAARLVAVVASPETAGAWVERARERTVKHLREEVDAAQMLGRLGIKPERCPPDEATMAELAAIEQRIVTGAVFRGEQSQTSAEAQGGVPHDRGPARSLRERSRGRVTLRFRVSVGTRRYYHWLERMFRRWSPRGVPFFRYLCLALIETWHQRPTSTEAYAEIYERDGHRCTSPVCGRHDVTPHHLIFRSAGGDDSPDNVASLCVWCHLEGVHGGRLTVTPPAAAMNWHIGRRPHTVVKGRQRMSVTAAETAG